MLLRLSYSCRTGVCLQVSDVAISRNMSIILAQNRLSQCYHVRESLEVNERSELYRGEKGGYW